MRLRTRFLLALAILSSVLIVAAILSARFVLTVSANEMDSAAAKSLLKRGQTLLSDEANALALTATDWASWDDTYAFMTNRGERYIAVNLVDGTFDSLRLDGILYYDVNRRYVVGKARLPGGDLSDSVPPVIRALVEHPDGLIAHMSEEPLAGFATGDGYVWLVALAPILTSLDEGPSRGALVMVRCIDANEKERLGRIIAPSLRLTAADSEGKPGVKDISVIDSKTLRASVVIAGLSEHSGIRVEIAVPRLAMEQKIYTLSFLVFSVVACTAGAWLLAVWLLDRWVLRSVTESVTALRQGLVSTVSAKGDRPTLRQTWNDEIGDLFEAVEAAISAVEASAREADKRRSEAVHSQRLAALGTLAAGIAHEINNPNGVISLNLNVLRRQLNRLFSCLQTEHRDTPKREAAGDLLAESRSELDDAIGETLLASDRIAGIIASLKGFAQPADDETKEVLDVPPLIKEAAHWLRHECERQGCRIETVFDEHLSPIRANRQQLVQVFVNLLQNARQATARPDVPVRVSVSCDRETGSVIIRVADEGEGMAPDDVEHALDPFYTTRRTVGGMGLGLSISAAIVKAHGGSLRIESDKGRGTVATVVLPGMEGGGDSHGG